MMHMQAPGFMVCLKVAWPLDILFHPVDQLLQLVCPGSCLSNFILAVSQLLKGRKSRCLASHGPYRNRVLDFRLGMEIWGFWGGEGRGVGGGGVGALGFRLEMEPVSRGLGWA